MEPAVEIGWLYSTAATASFRKPEGGLSKGALRLANVGNQAITIDEFKRDLLNRLLSVLGKASPSALRSSANDANRRSGGRGCEPGELARGELRIEV